MTRKGNKEMLEYKEFHNALRILRSIDEWEIQKELRERSDPAMTHDQWMVLLSSPLEAFVQLPDYLSKTIFAVLQKRM
jgi:hypothetical protein